MIKNQRMNLLKLALSALAILVGVVSLNREWSGFIRDLMSSDRREIISTAVGDVLGDGTPVEVVKIRTKDGIVLEVYVPGPQSTRVLLERIALDQEKDGYFNYNGQLVSLAIDDIDGDNTPEILAPAFDQQFTAHLNVFKFDVASRSFHKVTKSL
jgi:hypothetical protein